MIEETDDACEKDRDNRRQKVRHKKEWCACGVWRVCTLWWYVLVGTVVGLNNHPAVLLVFGRHIICGYCDQNSTVINCRQTVLRAEVRRSRKQLFMYRILAYFVLVCFR